MGASDYMVVASPNYAAYANPGFGMALGQMLAGLPDQYFQGTQHKRTLAQQNAFPNGMPVQKDADGNPLKDKNGNPIPDVNSIVNTGFRLGGAEYAAGMMPYLQGQNVSARQDQIDRGIQDFNGTPAANPRPNNGTAGPGNLQLPPPRQPMQSRAPQPQLSSAGTDNRGPQTVNSLASEVFGSRDVTELLPKYAAAVRNELGEPLTPQQEQAARAMMQRTAATMKQSQAPQRSSEDITPPSAPTSAAEQNGSAAAPIPGSGASGAPGPQEGPTQTPGPNRLPSQAGARPAIAASEPVEAVLSTLPANEAVLRAVASVLPAGVNPQSYQGYVRALDRAVHSTLSNAYQASLLPNGAARATQLQEQAKQYASSRDKILDAAKAAAEPTGSMKEWLAGRQPNETQADYEARKAGLKEAATAPYQIAAAAIREGGRPVTIKPNEVVTTGSTLDPALKGITDWASQRLGIPNAGTEPGAGTGQPQTAQNGQPAAGQSAFSPRMIRNPDGSVTSSVTPSTEKLQTTAAQNYEKARESYNGAQQTKQTLALMDNSFRTLNKTGWSSTGTGAEARLGLAKAVNSVWQTLGVKGQELPFDPNTIASWEDLQKNSTRLGFALARTLGAREAMQIVQGAIKANPSAQNTPIGARMVLNTIRQNAEHDNDYFEFATRFAQTHGGDLVGAEVAFNKASPPSLYARRAILQAQRDIPQEAIDQLRDNPGLAGAFDKHYGTAGLAKTFLPPSGAQ